MHKLTILLKVVCVLLMLMMSQAHTRKVRQRNSKGLQSFNLARLLLCYQGKPWSFRGYMFVASRYLKYGCWCGPMHSGSGSYAVDSIDRCCMYHDKCFSKTLKKHKVGIVAAFLSYYEFECKDQSATCTVGSPLARDICECDRSIAACIGPVRNQWSSTNLEPNSCQRR